VSEKEPFPFSLPSPHRWPFCGGCFSLRQTSIAEAISLKKATPALRWLPRQLRGSSSYGWGRSCLWHLCSRRPAQLPSWTLAPLLPGWPPTAKHPSIWKSVLSTCLRHMAPSQFWITPIRHISPTSFFQPPQRCGSTRARVERAPIAVWL